MERKSGEFKHPSYGMVQLSRRQGHQHLFGSALESHQNYMTLSVRRATYIRDDTGDRYFGSIRGDLIEVDMSSAQFAELITTMNVGMGVPCTIRTVGDQEVPRPPVLETEAENIRTEFAKRMKQFATNMNEGVASVEEILKKKGALTAAEKQTIQAHITKVNTELKSNLPFFLDMYQEAAEKISTAAKAEIEAFMTMAVQSAGIAALRAKAEETPVLALDPAKTGGSI
jgi:ElaB/YqjD/DUF883 family membrane-anchored ribosome-binding protein